MKVLSFNFDRISIERFSSSLNDLKISNKMDIKEIVEAQADFLSTQDKVLGVRFFFSLDYSPDIAKIEINGATALAVSPETSKEVIERWRKKEIPQDFKTNLFNFLFRKVGLKALELEEEFGLPSHIPFPVFKKSEDSKKD
ncbi:hypothetical protein HYT23_06080 [Candidatus Pacearchaeota archaeon]|nr:hypothetical protein [Candidatus Pacearchaeota archaeon]